MIKMGINGFGRIGRLVFRAASARDDVQVVGINDLLPAEHLAYLLTHDSVHGAFPGEVRVADRSLVVNGRLIRTSAVKDPTQLSWNAIGADLIVESTGLMLSQASATGHLTAGAGKVLVSAPCKDDTPTFVYGVNSDRYQGQAIVSAASCTTNCLAPIAQVLNDAYGIQRGVMTTIHATTATQKTVDGASGKDWRFGRGILGNIIPASTGAAKAIGQVLPELDGRLTGMSFRVPVSDVSVVDLTCQLQRETTYVDLCRTMQVASEGRLKGILGYTDEEVVSMDFRGNACTAIFDARAGLQLDPTFVKVVAWYDNEWAYSSKVVDLARIMVGATGP